MQNVATIQPRMPNIPSLVPDAYRAALALGKSAKRGGLPTTTAFLVHLRASSADPVPDDVWEQASEQYDEQALASLIIEIAVINVWNRFNVATRQPAGSQH